MLQEGFITHGNKICAQALVVNHLYYKPSSHKKMFIQKKRLLDWSRMLSTMSDKYKKITEAVQRPEPAEGHHLHLLLLFFIFIHKIKKKNSLQF